MSEAIELPYSQLDPDTLHRLLEEIVSRDGTDYGSTETPLEARVAQAIAHLKSGQALLIFEPTSESCQLVPKDLLTGK